MAKAKCRVEVLGVYAHDPSPKTIRAYAAIQADGTAADKVKRARRELKRAVLVEALIHHASRSFKFAFGQGGDGMNSFDWELQFLTLDGESRLGYDRPPRLDPLRVTFWIHEYSTRRPLRTAAGVVPLRPVCEMPPRLRKLVPYTVVD